MHGVRLTCHAVFGRSAAGPFIAPVLLLAASCAGTYQRTDVPSEERGVAELSGMIRDFKDAARDGDLERAAWLVDEMEARVAAADTVTRSHPDFEDVAKAAKRSRGALEIVRFKSTLERAKAILVEASNLLKPLATRPPTRDDLAALADALVRAKRMRDELRAIPEGSNGGSSAISGLADAIAKLEVAHTQATWICEATEVIGGAVETAVAEERSAEQTGSDTEAQLTHVRAAAQGFARCSSETDRARNASGFAPEHKIHTSLGAMTIEELALTCGFRQLSAERKMEKLSWRQSVRAVLQSIDTATANLEQSTDPQTRLEASRVVTEAYRACYEHLKNARKQPGYDARARFQLPSGSFAASKLGRHCRREQKRSEGSADGIAWTAAVDEVRDSVRDAEQKLHQISATQPRAERIGLLSSALVGFETCLDRADVLKKDLGRTRANARRSGAANKRTTLRALRRDCRRQYKDVKKKLRRLRRVAGRGGRKPAVSFATTGR